jgi:hypothetical protein
MALDILSAIQVAVEKIKEYIDRKPVVSYKDPQALTDAQKVQVRDNIGAASSDEIPNVPDWALSETKPVYTASEVGALPDDTVIPSLDGYATEDYVNARITTAAGVELDTTLTKQGQAADSKAVGDRISSIPVAVSDDGYTDISGLRQATSVDITRVDNTVTMVTMLEGGEGSVSKITLNDNGLPIMVVTDGIECAMDWSGFDVMYTNVAEVGA